MTDYVLRHLGPFDIPQIGPRSVRIYCPPRPPGGAPSPVLYMFDGQNVFDDEPSFAGGWHLHNTVRALAKRYGRAPVIVGVDHGGAARMEELSPWASGKTDALVDWIGGTLAPIVRRDFQASGEPREVGVGGSSLGGLAALYAHFRRPEHFGLVLAMSPSLFVGRGKIYEYIAAQKKPWTSRIYLDAGALEAGGGLLRAAERLASELQARGWDDGSLQFVVAKRGTHSEKAWRRRAPSAIEWLFLPGARKGRSVSRARPRKGS
jgi:predicted alpha/beta superfamily hydrolase